VGIRIVEREVARVESASSIGLLDAEPDFGAFLSDEERQLAARGFSHAVGQLICLGRTAITVGE
jgi:hypothetical protein